MLISRQTFRHTRMYVQRQKQNVLTSSCAVVAFERLHAFLPNVVCMDVKLKQFTVQSIEMQRLGILTKQF